jgi:hypothetical protein
LIVATHCWETCRALIFLIALRAISAQARFAPQEVLFAALTLRAARNYMRYSATLRSYSGFVEMAGEVGDIPHSFLPQQAKRVA